MTVILSLQFTITVIICFLYVRLSPYFSLSHKWLTGLEFCIPPEDKELSKLDATSVKKLKGKKGWLLGSKKNEIELKVAGIDDGTLVKHLFWEEYDQLVLALVTVTINFVFSEVWQYFTCERNTIMSAILLFSCGLCMKAMLSVILKLGLQSYELRLTILIGIISFLLSFFFLEVPETVFDFSSDIRIGFKQVIKNFNQVLKVNDLPYKVDVPLVVFKFFMATISSLISAAVFFPAFRLARSHHETGKYTPKPYHTVLSSISFLVPGFVLFLWVKPLARDLVFTMDTVKPETLVLLFETFRFYLLIFIATLRLFLLRPYMQSFLATAVGWAEVLLSETTSKERGKNIKLKILGIYSYLCVAAVQILAPSLLLMSLAFMLKSRGLVEMVLPSHCLGTPVSPIKGEIPSIFTETFYRGIFSYFSWWTLLAWFTISCFALVYERNQSIFIKKEF
eukprot:TRINITY_DN4766_c0_g1_i3.p1 TRINITY_DN4766_c0_g1~~TRINITY_DN4766_c0_g1_i3.p1  ORF type:complete len:451 (-),score=98.56 TRINITY_DN4766_c0_g1_i3:89-1441(-)